MNADQVRSLIRMGLHVGIVLDHPPMAALQDLAESLAAPIIQAVDDDLARPNNPCQVVHPEHGQCVLGGWSTSTGSSHVRHGTRLGSGSWVEWVEGEWYGREGEVTH